MKNLKFGILSALCLLTLLTAGCATNGDSATNAFKNSSAKQIFVGGETALAKADYATAIKHFEALDSLYPFGDEAKQAKIDIIYAYYKNDDYAPALAAADRYIHLYPRDAVVPYVYYMKGIVGLESNRTVLQKFYNSNLAELDLSSLRGSFSTFNELVQQFPDSIYAKDAHRRMIYIRNTLAEHELQTANFYFERKAYVAAINRAIYVVKHLNGSPQVTKALQLMQKSYQALGEQKKASDITQLLKK
ncbi:MAG: hypothetical protein A2X78_03790 [Gammaproteobacteria bacterium GWE2_37_16]|nr:MAG: hypothetical protein A2X78_03790 [Gammaproteobacteria bacterium GWE2_37_16]